MFGLESFGIDVPFTLPLFSCLQLSSLALIRKECKTELTTLQDGPLLHYLPTYYLHPGWVHVDKCY